MIKKGSDMLVRKLKKALYGLKLAPRAWYSLIECYFIKEDFESSSSDQTLFVKRKQGKIQIVSNYVDDLLFTGDDEELLSEFKCSMKRGVSYNRLRSNDVLSPSLGDAMI